MLACLTRISCCGIAASLLLAGVACFAFVCSRFRVLKSLRRRYPDKHDVDTDAEEREDKDKHGIDTHAEEREDKDKHCIDTDAEEREDKDKHCIDTDAEEKEDKDKHGIDTDAEEREDEDKHGIDTHAEEREDRISRLPDDVICFIISRLSTIDVVKTSLLSRRWRHVYTFIRDVRFFCSRIPYDSSCNYYHEAKKLRQLPRKFVQVGHIFDNFREWMNSVGSSGIEQLTLGYCCPYHVVESKLESHVFPSDFLPEASSVKHLCLKGCSIQTPNQNALKDLELNDVDLTSEAIECILSNCSSLQSLKLKYCVLPSKLCIHGPDLQLKRLTVSSCSEVAEIDLSAINLVTFEFCNFRTAFSFSNVPLLQNLFIEICGGDATPYVFENVSGDDLPHLQCLFFQNTVGSFESFEIGEVFNLRNLRQLALFLNYDNKLDLPALAAVLDACPLLHKFHLSMKQSSTFNGKQLAEKRVVSCHTQLKEVEFSGFNETENEYNFILFILKNIVSLKRLSIFVHFRSYDVDLGRWLATDGNPGDDKKKQRMIRTRLQGQANSKNVEITIV